QDGGEDTGLFADIAEAYDILSDDEKRATYDSNLKKYNEGVDVEQKKREEKFEQLFLRAKKRIRESRYSEAVEYFEKLENNYKYTNKQPAPEFYSYFGYALFMSGKDKKNGIDYMDKAVTKTMFSDEDFMANLAEAYYMNNEKKRADELIKQIFSVNPKSKKAYLLRKKYAPQKKSILDMIFRRK
ncbi:MAG: hypothetical protein PHW02_05380, partial [bacterium]|nr:hypothetical protein [bacterium]